MANSDFYTGNIPIKWLPVGYAAIMMLTCIYNFYLCNKNGTCYPWPYATITNCSTMYPNNVLFRFFLLLPSLSLLIIFGTYYKWLNYQSQRLLIGKFESPIAIKQLGFLGIPFFWLAVCTIDQGYMNLTLHSLGAVIFFSLWAFACWLIFFTLLKIYTKNPLVTSYYSIGAKLVIVLYQFIYVVKLVVYLLQPKDNYDGEVNSEKYAHLSKIGIYGASTPDVDPNNKYLVYIEWGTMFSCLIFIATLYYEFSNTYMSLDANYDYVFTDIQEKQQKLQERLAVVEQKKKEKNQVSEAFIESQKKLQQQQQYYQQQQDSQPQIRYVHQQAAQSQQQYQQSKPAPQILYQQQQQQQPLIGENRYAPQYIYVPQKQQSGAVQKLQVAQDSEVYQGIQLQQF